MSEESNEKPRRGPKPSPRPTEIGQSDSSGYTLIDKNEKWGLSLIRTPGGKFGVYANAWGVGGKEIRVLYPTNDRSFADSVLRTGKAPGKSESTSVSKSTVNEDSQIIAESEKPKKAEKKSVKGSIKKKDKKKNTKKEIRLD